MDSSKNGSYVRLRAGVFPHLPSYGLSPSIVSSTYVRECLCRRSPGLLGLHEMADSLAAHHPTRNDAVCFFSGPCPTSGTGRGRSSTCMVWSLSRARRTDVRSAWSLWSMPELRPLDHSGALSRIRRGRPPSRTPRRATSLSTSMSNPDPISNRYPHRIRPRCSLAPRWGLL